MPQHRRVIRTATLAAVVATVAACGAHRGIDTASATAAPAPAAVFIGRTSPNQAYSPVVKVGNMLYLAGQLGRDSAGNLPAGGVGPETTQALMNIKALLEKNGSNMDRVVKCTVFLIDMSEWGAMNRAYIPMFPSNRPARSAVGANGLVGPARVEIECMATVG